MEGAQKMVMGYTAIGFGVACGVIFLTWAWTVLNWVWFKPRKLERCLRKQGLNGNSYRLIFGDIKESYKMKEEANENPIPFTNDYFSRINPFQCQLIKKFGKSCFTWLGSMPIINIAEPELIRDVLSRTNEFKKPKINHLFDQLAPGLISLEGEKWTMHRKLINPAFHLEKLKLMIPAFSMSTSEMINKLEMMISEKCSMEIDVYPYLMTLSADAISRAAFSSSYEEGQRIFELLKEQTEWTLRLLQSFNLPGWKYVPTKNNRRMEELHAEIQNLLKGIIKKRKKAMEAGAVVNNDLLGILMESNLKETQSHDNMKKQHGMSFQDIIDECKLFYFAGQETTSVLLVWTMILLGKHQDWQTRAREEVLATFGTNLPDFEGLNCLKIVPMILYEVLRLYPPVVEISRKVYDHETKLGNLCVPPGAMVGLSILLVHQDPKLWGDDAKEFNPNRFSEGIAKATRGNLSFFPFSWGPRICIGQNFTIIEAKLAISMILQRFKFELSSSYIHAPTTIITLQPQFGAPIIFHQVEGRNNE